MPADRPDHSSYGRIPNPAGLGTPRSVREEYLQKSRGGSSTDLFAGFPSYLDAPQPAAGSSRSPIAATDHDHFLRPSEALPHHGLSEVPELSGPSSHSVAPTPLAHFALPTSSSETSQDYSTPSPSGMPVLPHQRVGPSVPPTPPHASSSSSATVHPPAESPRRQPSTPHPPPVFQGATPRHSQHPTTHGPPSQSTSRVPPPRSGTASITTPQLPRPNASGDLDRRTPSQPNGVSQSPAQRSKTQITPLRPPPQHSNGQGPSTTMLSPPAPHRPSPQQLPSQSTTTSHGTPPHRAPQQSNGRGSSMAMNTPPAPLRPSSHHLPTGSTTPTQSTSQSVKRARSPDEHSESGRKRARNDATTSTDMTQRSMKHVRSPDERSERTRKRFRQEPLSVNEPALQHQRPPNLLTPSMATPSSLSYHSPDPLKVANPGEDGSHLCLTPGGCTETPAAISSEFPALLLLSASEVVERWYNDSAVATQSVGGLSFEFGSLGYLDDTWIPASSLPWEENETNNAAPVFDPYAVMSMHSSRSMHADSQRESHSDSYMVSMQAPYSVSNTHAGGIPASALPWEENETSSVAPVFEPHAVMSMDASRLMRVDSQRDSHSDRYTNSLQALYATSNTPAASNTPAGEIPASVLLWEENDTRSAAPVFEPHANMSMDASRLDANSQPESHSDRYMDSMQAPSPASNTPPLVNQASAPRQQDDRLPSGSKVNGKKKSRSPPKNQKKGLKPETSFERMQSSFPVSDQPQDPQYSRYHPYARMPRPHTGPPASPGERMPGPPTMSAMSTPPQHRAMSTPSTGGSSSSPEGRGRYRGRNWQDVLATWPWPARESSADNQSSSLQPGPSSTPSTSRQSKEKKKRKAKVKAPVPPPPPVQPAEGRPDDMIICGWIGCGMALRRSDLLTHIKTLNIHNPPYKSVNGFCSWVGCAGNPKNEEGPYKLQFLGNGLIGHMERIHQKQAPRL